eukprot:TRINITY_DN16419_c0_g1_i1.p1 TRINITY_DN16419_c0_g1~~TRINITY_DN16419_c0_g1_i1.p1  ORF type:complete len:374 (-),score=98.18 TRINITY_DN16419_c0_g1_i1:117-1238(-)
MSSGEEGIPDFGEDIAYGDLILEEEIGRGAFGIVYRASYFGTSVAVKKIQQLQTTEDKMFLKREIAILKGVRHPSCVQFIGLTNDDEGEVHIVTEFVSGGNLREALKDQERHLSWFWRVSIAADIAGAMAYLHSKNIIFRDLKSKNVLIEGNRAKICDFGLARAKTSSKTKKMTICGTDEWMAPEVILGMDYDIRADVFSYGIVLLEIISRTKVSITLQRSPMDAFGLNEDAARAIIPKDCPEEFSVAAFSCSDYEPEKRPLLKNLSHSLSKLAKTLPVNEPSKAAAAAPVAKANTPTPTPAPTPVPVTSSTPTNTPTKSSASKGGFQVAQPSSSAKKAAPAASSASPAKSFAPPQAESKSTKKIGGIVWPPK